MSSKNEIYNGYFNWLYDIVCDEKFPKRKSFRKLLTQLHSTNFIWKINKDENRAEDGIDLRRRFAMYEENPYIARILKGPCSVLEMMVALAIRCEETIMDDTCIGDRTGQWFWSMISNLGLGSMSDDNFDEIFVEEVVSRFLNREYEPDGKGGLFRIRHCHQDLRRVEIWYQLCWYLDEIV